MNEEFFYERSYKPYFPYIVNIAHMNNEEKRIHLSRYIEDIFQFLEINNSKVQINYTEENENSDFIFDENSLTLTIDLEVFSEGGNMRFGIHKLGVILRELYQYLVFNGKVLPNETSENMFVRTRQVKGEFELFSCSLLTEDWLCETDFEGRKIDAEAFAIMCTTFIYNQSTNWSVKNFDATVNLLKKKSREKVLLLGADAKQLLDFMAEYGLEENEDTSVVIIGCCYDLTFKRDIEKAFDIFNPIHISNALTGDLKVDINSCEKVVGAMKFFLQLIKDSKTERIIVVAFEKPVIFQAKAAQETVRFLSDCNLELFMYDYNNFSSNKLFNQAERESIEWLNENLESSHNHIKLFIEPEMDISSINGIRDLITLRCKEIAKAVVDVVKI